MLRFEQGVLDGLCGPYSVLNAISAAAGPRSAELDPESLFERMIDLLGQSRRAPEVICNGTTLFTLMSLVRSLAGDLEACGMRLELRRATSKASLPLADFWSRLQAHLEMPGTAAILGLSGNYDHWTCAVEVTDKTLLLRDSSIHLPKRLRRTRCTTAYRGGTSARPYEIWPNHTLLLSISEPLQG